MENPSPLGKLQNIGKGIKFNIRLYKAGPEFGDENDSPVPPGGGGWSHNERKGIAGTEDFLIRAGLRPLLRRRDTNGGACVISEMIIRAG